MKKNKRSPKDALQGLLRGKNTCPVQASRHKGLKIKVCRLRSLDKDNIEQSEK